MRCRVFGHANTGEREAGMICPDGTVTGGNAQVSPRVTNRFRWTAALLACAVLLSCSFFAPTSQVPMMATAPVDAVVAPTQQATFIPLRPAEATQAPSTGPVPSPTEAAAPAPGSLAIADSLPFDTAGGVLGYSMTASPGKVWVGTGTASVLMTDSATGQLLRTIQLQADGGAGNFVVQMDFDGRYVVAFEMVVDSGETPQTQIYAIDSETGEIARHYNLHSTDWTTQDSDFEAEAFGVSPGRIWVDGRVIDTSTWDVTQDVPMPAYTRFAYNGNGWMWMTGDTGGGCDDLVFARVENPTDQVCDADLPFVPNVGPSGGEVVPAVSSMTRAGDTMWMLAGQPGGGIGPYTIVAYPADMEQLKERKGPLAIVPLMTDDSSDIHMAFAGGSLWLAWETGDLRGWLYRLDPRSGATLGNLDLVEEAGRLRGEVALDLATEGDNLWVLTLYRLIRIRL